MLPTELYPQTREGFLMMLSQMSVPRPRVEKRLAWNYAVNSPQSVLKRLLTLFTLYPSPHPLWLTTQPTLSAQEPCKMGQIVNRPLCVWWHDCSGCGGFLKMQPHYQPAVWAPACSSYYRL